MKKVLCFFGIHQWANADDDWSYECKRCGRFLIPTPAGDLIPVNWFKFWYRASKPLAGKWAPQRERR